MRAWMSRLIGVVVVASVVAAGVSLDVHAQGPYSAQIAALLAGDTQVTGSWTFNNLTVTGTCTGCTGTGVGGSLGATQVAYGAALNTMAGSANLTWTNSGGHLNILTGNGNGLWLTDTGGTTVKLYAFNDGSMEIDTAALLVSDLKNTGSAASKKVVCVDTATGRLYASSTGTDCSN